MASLGLKALMYGADKIPDSWFEKVPGGYYREKKRVENERNKQRRRARHYSDVVHGRDDDDGYLSDDYEARKGRNRHQSDFDDDDDEYHGKDRSRRNRGKSVGASRGNLDGSRSEDPPLRPYNPAEYGPVGVGEREEYYNGRHQGTGGDGTRYVPIGLAEDAAAAEYADHRRPHSSKATGGYVPYADVYGQEPQMPHQSRLQRDMEYENGSQTGRRSRRASTPYARAAYVSDDYPTSESAHSRSSGRSHRHRDEKDDSRSRRKSRNHSRARSSVRDRFDTSDKGLGYGTIGALAGGLMGSEMGRGGVLPTVAGAVIGGLGANAFEGREKHKKDARKSNRYDDAFDATRRSGKRASHGYDGYYSD